MIQKDYKHYNLLLEALSNTCDPFSEFSSSSKNLSNISIKRATSEETKEYLVNSIQIGRELQNKFQEECAASEDRL